MRGLLDFCPKCGTRMRVKRVEGGVKLICPKCGHEEFKKTKVLQAKYEVSPETRREALTVLTGEESEISTLPTTQVECPKCGYGEAYWWIIQTRSADEAPTQFFKCKRCGYVWREYS